jgi:3-deoxy-7-phosphoheptulonate synthase
MHGNTHTASNPPFLKTRHFSAIIHELTECLRSVSFPLIHDEVKRTDKNQRIHEECNSTLNGVSLEFTGELDAQGFSVTECLGGSMELKEEELGLRYQVQ